MNQDIKKKWVEALRSGKYRQARRRLRDDTGAMCCLGVLCDIVKEDVGMDWNGGEFGNSWNLPPSAVVRFSELPDRNPDIDLMGESTLLAELNDNGLTFPEIADAIERSL